MVTLKRFNLTIIFGIIAALALMMVVAGCGDEEEDVSVACNVEAESIIPAPGDKPQHVYFYSPT